MKLAPLRLRCACLHLCAFSLAPWADASLHPHLRSWLKVSWNWSTMVYVVAELHLTPLPCTLARSLRAYQTFDHLCIEFT